MLFLITAAPMGRTLYVARGSRLTKGGWAIWTAEKAGARLFTSREAAAFCSRMTKSSGTTRSLRIVEA